MRNTLRTRYIFWNDNSPPGPETRFISFYIGHYDSRVHSPSWNLKLSRKNTRTSLRGATSSFFPLRFNTCVDCRSGSSNDAAANAALWNWRGRIIFCDAGVKWAPAVYTHAISGGFPQVLGRKRFPRCKKIRVIIALIDVREENKPAKVQSAASNQTNIYANASKRVQIHIHFAWL